jgi:protein tyrosine/serine phosphatase
VWLLAAANVVLLVVVAVLVGGRMRQASLLPPNFSVVEPQRLYRSGQPTAAQLATVIKEYGIRTVLNLRNPAEPDYVDDAPAARPYGVSVVSLPITSTWAMSDEHLSELRKVYGDPGGYPILVHCEEGHARTGVAVAIWRIERQGWDPAAAVDDMIASGYPVREKRPKMRELLLHWKVPAEAPEQAPKESAPSPASP